MRMVALDMNGDASAWEKIVKLGIDVALMRNMVRPPSYVLPYIEHAVGKWLDEPNGELTMEKAAVVCFCPFRQLTWLGSNRISFTDNDETWLSYYVHDNDNYNTPNNFWPNAEQSAFVCSDVDLDLENHGFVQIIPQLYWPQETTPLKIYVRDSGQWCAYEVVNTVTGVPDPSLMLLISAWNETEYDEILLPVRGSRGPFLSWLDKKHEILIAFGDGGAKLVPCSHVRRGDVPTYKGKPIMYWNGEYR